MIGCWDVNHNSLEKLIIMKQVSSGTAYTNILKIFLVAFTCFTALMVDFDGYFAAPLFFSQDSGTACNCFLFGCRN
jgi:hypothetical protein